MPDGLKEKAVINAAITPLEKAGRCSSGRNGDHGRIAHAVPGTGVEGSRATALCGALPGTKASWSSYASDVVTCRSV